MRSNAYGGRPNEKAVHDAPQGDSWLIADMYLDGVISELVTRRS
jgi:hypothetical protein